MVGARNAEVTWPRIWSRSKASGMFSRPTISDGVSVRPADGLSGVASVSV